MLFNCRHYLVLTPAHCSVKIITIFCVFRPVTIFIKLYLFNFILTQAFSPFGFPFECLRYLMETVLIHNCKLFFIVIIISSYIISEYNYIYIQHLDIIIYNLFYKIISINLMLFLGLSIICLCPQKSNCTESNKADIARSFFTKE